MCLDECSLLAEVLNKAVEWEKDASSLLQNANHLWKIDITKGISSCFMPKFEWEVLSMDSALKAGISLGLKFNLIPKLEDACSKLRWCIKALSFCTSVPARKVIYFFPSLQNSDARYMWGNDENLEYGGKLWSSNTDINNPRECEWYDIYRFIG